MNRRRAAWGALTGGLLILTQSTQGVASPAPRAAVVVGTFDSRAVAVAYIRSKATSEYLRDQKADLETLLERARAAGDRALEADLDALGPAMQARFHRMGFSTAPVDDVIALIEPELPGIARAAGVDLIVSKWSLSYRDPEAELVDVTDLLVEAFDPDDATRKTIRELVATDPVPTGELTEHH